MLVIDIFEASVPFIYYEISASCKELAKLLFFYHIVAIRFCSGIDCMLIKIQLALQSFHFIQFFPIKHSIYVAYLNNSKKKVDTWRITMEPKNYLPNSHIPNGTSQLQLIQEVRILRKRTIYSLLKFVRNRTIIVLVDIGNTAFYFHIFNGIINILGHS